MKPVKTILIILLLSTLSGCNIMPQHIHSTPAISKKMLDTASFRHASVSGKPLPFSSLKYGQIPKATQCQSIWDERPRGDVTIPKKEMQDVTIYIFRHVNAFHQTLLEYKYENESTGDTWREYYVNRQLIYRGNPQSEYNFFLRWAGRGQLLFRSENDSGFFFLLDVGHRTLLLFDDCQWNNIPLTGETVTDDIWEYHDPSMEVKLCGYDEQTGQVLFYVTHQHTTLFEYNPLWPNRITILLDNLPAQVSGLPNYIMRGNFVTRRDGTLWFCVESNGNPDWSGIVFQYDSQSNVLTPVFFCTGRQGFYFYKETIALHWAEGGLSIFDYNTSTVYPPENCSGMYVITEIGPSGLEYIKTYSESEKRHYLWDTAGNRRYYVTYDDIVSTYPDSDSMMDGDVIVYLHGSGWFYAYREEDNRCRPDSYRIDWYAAIRHPLD